jgi:hypothetical protein
MKPYKTLVAPANGFKKHGLGFEQLKLLLDDMPNINLGLKLFLKICKVLKVLVLKMNSSRI